MCQRTGKYQSYKDLVSLQHATPAASTNPDSILKQSILRELLETTNIDSNESDNDVNSVYNFCFNCKHPSKIGKNLKKLVSIRKYHNHTLQTIIRHHEEELQNINNHQQAIRKTIKAKQPAPSSSSR